MTQDEWGYVVIGIVAVALLWVVFRPVKDDGEPRPATPLTPRPSLPPFCAVPEQREASELHEWLPMSPDQRAAEADWLRAMWPNHPAWNAQTDLRADPGPHEAA